MREEQRFPLERVVSGGVAYDAYRLPFQNLYETLERTASDFPEKIGIIDADRQITFGDLKKETDAFSAYLYHMMGVRPGDVVALMQVNSIEFAVSFYAVLKIGASVVSINTKYGPTEIKFVLDDSQAGYLITDAKWYPRAREILAGTGVRHVLSSGPCEELLSMGRAEAMAKELPVPPTVRDDSATALIMYTSGTTGRSKGASMTHFNLMQAMYAYAVADDMDDKESTVLAVPAFHITGLNCVLTLFIFLGGLMVMIPYFDPVEALDKMTQYQITHFHAVATIFIMLESAMQDRHNLSGLRTALCGGGFISSETVARFCTKAPNCKFHPVYGMTETSGAGTYFLEHCLDSSIENSCGKVVPNCAIRIVDPQGREVPTGVSGEICFKGAFVIRNYLHNVGSASIRDGWLASGDVGCFDEDGNLYIKDRIKDMINRGGEKIFSLGVEDQIMEFGGIRQAAVFAVDDSLYGEVPAAVIIPETGHTVDTEQLRIFLRARLAHYKVPVYMEVRSSMPTTANGKVKKSLLRQEFNGKYSH